MDMPSKELINTIIQRGSFFLLLLVIMSGFAWMQHYLLSRKKPWLWRLGVSIGFISLLLLLFEAWGLSLDYFSLPEALIYLVIALSVFATITIVNSIYCLKLLKVSVDRRALLLGAVFVCIYFIFLALYFIYHPINDVLFMLKRITFVSALFAVATSLMVLLFEMKKS